jgi:hypothetical protein
MDIDNDNDDTNDDSGTTNGPILPPPPSTPPSVRVPTSIGASEPMDDSDDDDDTPVDDGYSGDPDAVRPTDPRARAHHQQRELETSSRAVPELTLDEVVEEILEGKWGDPGEARKQRLRVAGYSVLAVEAEVQRRQV